jgi:hypothetical protein
MESSFGCPYSRCIKGISGNFEEGWYYSQCALGFRIATLMLRIGVKEDYFESFMSDVYNRCKDIGLSPQDIGFHLADLLEFSKTVPFSKIPEYVKQQAHEKEELEKEIENLKVEVEGLRELRDAALKDERMTSSELKWYTDLTNCSKDRNVGLGGLGMILRFNQRLEIP